MKGLETERREVRPVGYGMIDCLRRRIVLHGGQRLQPQIIPFPTGRIMSVAFPGISCLATIVWSLWDKYRRVLLLRCANSRRAPAAEPQLPNIPILRAAETENSLSNEANALWCRPLKSASQARHAPQPGRRRSRKDDDEDEYETAGEAN
jgi:hypothetical protein